ncbi:hypothetical protein CABS03_14134 [Colletotrichum abscissum]|uniref:Uncharacterized protein n=1 Tax=Colletotrichum abscissum TaxID=1671311 RepID=A0A9Q0B1I0_9PEZI|nr:hypothetical protein CABS02_11091 [Colletotrichum abscissum]
MQGTSNQSPVSSHLLIFPERRLPGSNTEDPQPRTWSGLLSPAALWHSCSSADLLSCRLTRLATPPFPLVCQVGSFPLLGFRGQHTTILFCPNRYTPPSLACPKWIACTAGEST